MRRVFKTRSFVRWMRKTDLPDTALCKAVDEMSAGLIDADLGGSIIKKRVPLPGRGKSGSTRTLVATRKTMNWFFVYGFEKSQRGNISAGELEALQILAGSLIELSAVQLTGAVVAGALQKICHEH